MDEPFICGQCDRGCDLRYEYDLELESGTYPVRWFRCPACGGEYLQAPDLLLAEDLGPGPEVGPYRAAALCHATSVHVGEEGGGRSVRPLLATAFDEGLVDAVLLPDFGPRGDMRVVTDPEDVDQLRRFFLTSSRAISMNAALPANLDFLLGLERFAREDRGAHPKIGVVGRPCHVYAARRANLARIAPGHEIALTLGLFCYGNLSPDGSAAAKFERLTGIPPAQIRGLTVSDDKVRVAGADQRTVDVPLRNFSSLLHKTCMKCVDFTVPWADLSMGENPQIPGFDLVLARTALGERLLRSAIATGRLRSWSPEWMGGPEGLRILDDIASVKRSLAQARA